MHISNVNSSPALEAAQAKIPASKAESGTAPSGKAQADGHTSHTHQGSAPSMPGMGNMVDEVA